MIKKLTRIAPWQAAKVAAVVHFVLGLVFAIPFVLLSLFMPMESGQGLGMGLSLGVALMMPLLYAVGGFITTALLCALYNMAAGFTGGLEFNVEPE